MTNKDYEVAYICNGKDPKCSNKTGCYYKITNGIRGSCSHTTNPKYAVHKKLDPKKNPEMFDKFSTIQGTRYYERDKAKER